MQWTYFVLNLVLIGFVSGKGAWKENKIYKYKLDSATSLLSEGGQHVSFSRIHLTIRPLSDNIVIGEITEIRFVQGDEQISAAGKDEAPVDTKSQLLNKEFIVHLKNGVIQSVSADRTLTTSEVNQLKFVVSQFQLDPTAENYIQSDDDQLPNDSGFYKVMEATVTGECETSYNITLLSDELASKSRVSLPVPELDGEIVTMLKIKNYNKCDGQPRYLLYLVDAKDDSNGSGRIDSSKFSLVTSTRITGTLDDYTLQQSVSTFFVNGDVTALTELNYLTLESVELVDVDVVYQPKLENMENHISLVYSVDTKQTKAQTDDAGTIPATVTSSGLLQNSEGFEDRWSGCWTAFPSAADICKNNFSPEWVNVDSKCCGWGCLGKMALCRRKFVGCETTSCYFGATNKIETTCQKEFSDRLPVYNGWIDDCAPGFFRARCCPK